MRKINEALESMVFGGGCVLMAAVILFTVIAPSAALIYFVFYILPQIVDKM